MAVLLALAAVGGCGGLQNVPLPGGANLGNRPYEVNVVFANVLDLVPQSLVKVNDVAVGTVRDLRVEPDTWNAVATLAINGDVRLPANAQARVRSTSLLGEKFVELATPAQPTGTLAEGATIPIAVSSRATEVEEVLGALSMLLNGGGVAQIRTIAVELNAALEGNEPQIRALLADLNKLVGTLDASKSDITRALDALNRLAAVLAARTDQIALALDDLEPGLKVLVDQRDELVTMLNALNRLSVVATKIIQASRDDVIADLNALRPILQNLAAAGEDLPNSLELLFTVPFTDGATEAFRGDYANLYVKLDLDLTNILNQILGGGPILPGLPFEVPGLGAGPGELLTPLLGGQPGAPAPLLTEPSVPSPGGAASLLGPIVGGGR
jgi:phospholipid/cholesterol/gamma-HCH transport system substrate-binding protein